MFIPGPKHPKIKIGLIRTSSIGDCILASACVDFLLNLPFEVQVTWICKSPTINLLRSAFPTVNFIELGQSDKNLSEINRIVESVQNLHILIDLQTNLRSRMICLTANRRYGIKTYQANRKQLFRNRLLLEARFRGRKSPLPETSKSVKFMQYSLMVEVVKRALGEVLPKEYYATETLREAVPKISFEDQHPKPWENELKFGLWLAVAPGAANPTKRSPTDTFKNIIELTAVKTAQAQRNSKDPLGVVFLGGAEDREVCMRLIERLACSGPKLNLAGRLSLTDSAIALEKCSFLLTNDSALSHLSEAVGTPVGVLFGPTIESFGFAPRLTNSRAFSKNLGCRPCSKHGKTPCRYGDQLCLRDLDHEAISRHLAANLVEPEELSKADKIGPPSDEKTFEHLLE